MPKTKRVEEAPISSKTHRSIPESFANYRSQVAHLLSQEERLSNHDQQQAITNHSDTAIGAGMSNLMKENLNVLLRQCVRNLIPEVDEMQQRVFSMYHLISKLQNKCPTSSPRSSGFIDSAEARDAELQFLLDSDPVLVKKITSQSSTFLLSKLENMQQQLENLLNDVVTTCRPMTHGEIRSLQESIKELPERNLNHIAKKIGNYYITSGKDFSDEVTVNLNQLDNIMLWRLYFYVGAVKSASNLDV